MELLLETSRLTLRPFSAADAPAVQHLVCAREIAEMTLNIPHPYPDGAALMWISTHDEKIAQGTEYPFAITDRVDGSVYGAIGLRLEREHSRAELGYWIGLPYWGQGYATEAGKALLAFGFQTLGLHRIYAFHFGRNPASGRVLQKIGLLPEGCQRQHLYKNGRHEDLMMYGALAAEWIA